jgi:hypothetical protein
MEAFDTLYNLPLGSRGYDLDVLATFRGLRFENSVSTNGYFFYGPFTGYAIQTATYIFTYRYFANHSAQYPEGYLDGETLKSFVSVTGEPGSFVYTPGHEKIPDTVSFRPSQPRVILSYAHY